MRPEQLSRQKCQGQSLNIPSVTVSILNYQRKETLRLALERALAQDYPDLEVLVVDIVRFLDASRRSGRIQQERRHRLRSAQKPS